MALDENDGRQRGGTAPRHRKGVRVTRNGAWRWRALATLALSSACIKQGGPRGQSEPGACRVGPAPPPPEWLSPAALRLAVQDDPGEFRQALQSPDGRLLMTTSSKGLIFWDARTGRQLRHDFAEWQRSHAVGFLADGRPVSADERGLWVWALDSLTPARFLENAVDASGLRDARLSADGRALAIRAERTQVVRLSDVAGRRELPRADDIALSGDGKWVALVKSLRVGHTSVGVDLYEVETGRRDDALSHVMGLPWLETANKVAFSADGSTMAMWAHDGAEIVDLVARKRRHLRLLEGERFPPDASLALSADGRRLAIGPTLGLWDTNTGAALRAPEGQTLDGRALSFGKGGDLLVGSPRALTLVSTGSSPRQREYTGESTDVDVNVSPDGKLLVVGTPAGDTWLWDVTPGRKLRRVGLSSAVRRRDGARPSALKVALSGNGNVAALLAEDTLLGVDLAGGGTLWSRPQRPQPLGPRPLLAISPDARRLTIQDHSPPTVVDGATGLDVAAPLKECSYDNAPAFSSDGRLLACLTEKGVALFDAATAARRWEAESPRNYTSGVGDVTFGAGDGEVVTLTQTTPGEFTVRAWGVDGGAERRNAGLPRRTYKARFSPDRKHVIFAGHEMRPTIVELASGKQVATVPAGRSLELVGDAMLAVDDRRAGGVRAAVDLVTGASMRFAAAPEGDPGAETAAYEGVARQSWRLGARHVLTHSNAGLYLWSLETGRRAGRLLFFRDRSWAFVDSEGRFDTNRPEGLAALHWRHVDDPYRALPFSASLRDYFEADLLSRLLSGETLTSVPSRTSVDPRQPLVRIAEARLSPDGEFFEVVVEVERGPAASAHDLRLFRDGRMVGAWPEATGEAGRDHRSWRRATCIPLPESGKLERRFRVARSHQRAGEKSQLTAYAFNADGVRSEVASFDVEPLAGAPAARRAFVVAIGVGGSENPSPAWRLTYAADDARLVASAVRRAFAGDRSTRVETLELLGTAADKYPVPSKANIKAALESLAARARPDDLVFVWFSGHGYATERGDFYLLPYDLGRGPKSSIDREVLEHAIRADELSLWLSKIDARKALAIDACQSGAAILSPGFKPGPFAARSLGQLAYDQSILTLVAAQADVSANASVTLGHSLLAYAFGQRALNERRASAGGKTTLEGAFEYAAGQVPPLYERYINGGSKAGRQSPSVFNFGTEREIDLAPALHPIGRP